jgi:hypothetical protein
MKEIERRRKWEIGQEERKRKKEERTKELFTLPEFNKNIEKNSTTGEKN